MAILAQLGSIVVQSNFFTALPSPQPGAGGIGREPVEPGRQRGLPTKRPGFFIEGYKDILGDFFSLGGVAEQVQGVTEDARPIPSEQGVEGGCIPRADAGDEDLLWRIRPWCQHVAGLTGSSRRQDRTHTPSPGHCSATKGESCSTATWRALRRRHRATPCRSRDDTSVPSRLRAHPVASTWSYTRNRASTHGPRTCPSNRSVTAASGDATRDILSTG